MLFLRLAATMMLCLAAAAPGHAGNWPPSAADISVTLTPADGSCLEGDDCRLAMQIENLGTAPFKGGLRVIVETATPSVPGSIDADEGACERLAYGRMACAAEALDLAPSETMTGLVSVRFLPTVKSEVEACASIEWPGAASPVARDASKSVATALGKEVGAGVPLSAVFGAWGQGDLRQGNDRGCVTIAIGPTPARAQCPAGQGRIAGRCGALDDFCSSDRTRDKVTGNCACSAGTPNFDPVKRVCATAAILTCDGGRTAKDGVCFCPEATPLWNADQKRCQEWRPAKPAVAKVEVEAEPSPPPPAAMPKIAPAPAPKVNAPVKKVDVPVRKRVVAKPSCGRDETLRGKACVKIVRKAAKRPKPVRVAQRVKSGPSAEWRRKKLRCPPIIPACVPILIHQYRKRKREARGE